MITLDLTPTEESQVSIIARQSGLAPAEYVKKLVQENLPPVPAETAPTPAAKKTAAIALLESWIEAAPTHPEEIRRAEAERNEFLQNLNQNRLESGEIPLFP
jgi:hypothetical protein